MNPVERVLRDFIGLFDQLCLQYAIMGGIAVRAHGIPRPTYDVDVTVLIDRSELGTLFAAARELEYEISDEFDKGWVDTVAGMPLVKATTFQNGRTYPVDIFLAETEFQKTLVSRRQRENLDALETWLVTPEDLILLKLIANRPRDLADVYDVLTMQVSCDLEYLRSWADKLDVRSRLEEVLAEHSS